MERIGGFSPPLGHPKKKSSMALKAFWIILLAVSLLAGALALTLSWLLAQGVIGPSSRGGLVNPPKTGGFKQPKKLDFKDDINNIRNEIEKVASDLRLDRDTLIKILLRQENAIDESKEVIETKFNDEAVDNTIDDNNIITESEKVEEIVDEKIKSQIIYKEPISELIDSIYDVDEEVEIITEAITINSEDFFTIENLTSEKVEIAEKSYNENELLITTIATLRPETELNIINEEPDSTVFSTSDDQSEITTTPSETDEQSSHWTGSFHYPGYGLFSIGKSDAPFELDLIITDNSIMGNGSDSQGTFVVSGTLESWTKSYTPSLCSNIKYVPTSVTTSNIKGTASFQDCSTAKFLADNPGLAAFAPSKSSGAGTFSMDCKSECNCSP